MFPVFRWSLSRNLPRSPDLPLSFLPRCLFLRYRRALYSSSTLLLSGYGSRSALQLSVRRETYDADAGAVDRDPAQYREVSFNFFLEVASERDALSPKKLISLSFFRSQSDIMMQLDDVVSSLTTGPRVEEAMVRRVLFPLSLSPALPLPLLSLRLLPSSHLLFTLSLGLL